jgi:hypothetical protein
MKVSSNRKSGVRRVALRRGPRHRIKKEGLVRSIGSEAASDASHLPVSVLTQLRNSKFQPEIFASMLNVFGHLPERGQYKLAARLIRASQVYRRRKLVEQQQRVLPNRVTRLKSISTSARGILKLLGVNDPTSVAVSVGPESIHPIATYLLPRFYSIGAERRPAAVHIGADERLRNLILLLSDLVKAASMEAASTKAAEELAGKVGHGGKRREGPTVKAELCQAIIASYDEFASPVPK